MQQLQLFEDEKTVEEEITEQGLRRGSRFEGGKQRILEFANTNPTITEFSRFLKDEYGVGGFGSPDRTPYKVNGEHHDSRGIKFRYHDEEGNEHEVTLDWNKAAQVIIEMVEGERYAI